MPIDQQERARRWRLILGGGGNDGTCCSLGGSDQGMDRTLEALYESDRKGGLGSSSPNVARWLGDIREYFPTSVVKVMQSDALERLNLQQMLLEPEMRVGRTGCQSGRDTAHFRRSEER